MMNNDPYSREEASSDFIEVRGLADLKDLC